MSKNYSINKTPLSKKEMWIYGAADIFGGGSATLVALLLLGFLNNGMKIEAGIVSTIIMVSKIWDAISDPLMGVISDNTRSKLGRRKPYLIIGGILIIPALAMLFAPIVNITNMTTRVIFAAVAYLFYCSVSTISQVPYCSMSSDISPDHVERNKANFVKLIFDIGAAGVCYLIPSIIFPMYMDGKLSFWIFYAVIVGGFGLMFSLPLILAGFKVNERVPYEKDRKEKFSLKLYRDCLGVKSYRLHLLMYIGAFLCMDIISALAVYYTADVMRDVTIFGMKMSMIFVVGPMMVFAGASVPMVYYFMKKKSKQFAYRVGIPLYIFSGIALAFYPTTWNPIFIPLLSILMGIGFGGAQMMPWLIFPDTVEVGELKYGYRPTGAFSGMMTFSRKLSTAVSIGLVGWMLTLSGQIPGGKIQPDSVIWSIRIMMAVSILLLLSLGFFASIKYKITDEKLIRIRYFNEHNRNKSLDSLTDEEQKEKEALLKELS